MCGNSKFCIDQDKVCDGFGDCLGNEDEKKCTALIDDVAQKGIIFSDSYVNLTSSVERRSPTGNHSRSESITEESLLDQEAIESVADTSTLHVLADVLRPAKLTNDRNLLPQIDREESLRRKDESEVTFAASGREISSSALRNTLTRENDPRVTETRGNRTFPASAIFHREIESYNDKGYLSVRKNGKWGRLCLSDTFDKHDGPLRGKQRGNAWSMEDLAKAACKAITYQ